MNKYESLQNHSGNRSANCQEQHEGEEDDQSGQDGVENRALIAIARQLLQGNERQEHTQRLNGGTDTKQAEGRGDHGHHIVAIDHRHEELGIADVRLAGAVAEEEV